MTKVKVTLAANLIFIMEPYEKKCLDNQMTLKVMIKVTIRRILQNPFIFSVITIPLIKH